MGRHPYTITALAVTFLVHAKTAHCLLIHYKFIITFIQAVRHRMWAYFGAMLTTAHAKSIMVIVEMFVIIILDYFFESFDCLIKWLAILAKSSL